MRKLNHNSSEEQQEQSSEFKLPVVFKYTPNKERAIVQEVFLVGTFTSWKDKVAMAKSEGEFVAIVDLPEGEHQYKFVVDGNWEHDPNQNSIDDNYNGRNNMVAVKRSDFESSDAVAPVQENATVQQEIPSIIAQEKPIEDSKEPARPVETTTQDLIDIEPTPVVEATPVVQETPEALQTINQVVQETLDKQVNDILESFTSFEDFLPKEKTLAETVVMTEDVVEPSVVPEERPQEPAPAISDVDDFFQLASKVLEKEDPVELFAQVAQDAQLIEPAQQAEMFDELKKLAEQPTMQKSGFELLDILTANFASQIEQEQEKEMIEEEAKNAIISEQPTDSMEHFDQIETTEQAIEEIQVPETRQKLIETQEVPAEDTDGLVAEEPVEIVDLTDKAIKEPEITERRQSIVVEQEDEVQVCELDHPSDTNSSDKLIKKEPTEKTELKPKLLDQPFFQRLNSLSLKEKLMVCFGGLVAVFVFAASVFL